MADCLQKQPQLFLFLYPCCFADETWQFLSSRHAVYFPAPWDYNWLWPIDRGRGDIMLVPSLRGHRTLPLTFFGPLPLPCEQVEAPGDELMSNPSCSSSSPKCEELSQNQQSQPAADPQLISKARGIPAECKKPAGWAQPKEPIHRILRLIKGCYVKPLVLKWFVT